MISSGSHSERIKASICAPIGYFSVTPVGAAVRGGVFTVLTVLLFSFSGQSREFLLSKEIEQIREAQEIDRRTELYLKFASLRMATFKERVKGKESNPGDPLEFYSLDDLIYGFGRCLKAVEDNVDETVSFRRVEAKRLVKALTLLKNYATQALPDLDAAGKFAVTKKDEALYRAVQTATEITQAALEGSTEGLRRYDKEQKKTKSSKK